MDPATQQGNFFLTEGEFFFLSLFLNVCLYIFLIFLYECLSLS